jgi:cytochrome oxidase assembly protein ShyY1
MDPQAMIALGGVPANSPILTQIQDNESGPDDLTRPSVDQVAMPNVSPAIHAGYAVTWYGLSLAGVLLTRKLILRR